MTDVRALLVAATQRLGGAQARAEAEILLTHALQRSRTWLYAHSGHVPDAVERAEFERLLDARAAGEPVAYLTGRRAFRDLELVVTPDVLIPRPETELLVEAALQRLPADRDAAVADLGTGSGAIALAIASERPRVSVLATDASEAALEVARANAVRLGLDRVRFACGDWCTALGSARFDLVASNPPYIAEGDPHLAQGDLRREPPAALASGADGLDAIRAIIGAAPAHLLPGGWLLLEHGFAQGAAVRALLRQRGFLEIASLRDLAGHERTSLGRLA